MNDMPEIPTDDSKALLVAIRTSYPHALYRSAEGPAAKCRCNIIILRLFMKQWVMRHSSRGKRAITADTALRLGKYFAVSPEIWLDLQSDYELWVLRLISNCFGGAE